MGSRLEDFVFSIEFILKWPFVYRMPIRRLPLSTRLELEICIGISGKPKRFAVSKLRGYKDALRFSDGLKVISFPMPDLSFRPVLTQEGGLNRQTMGRYTWLWSKDGMILRAFDEGAFDFTQAEARVLDAAVFQEHIGQSQPN